MTEVVDGGHSRNLATTPMARRWSTVSARARHLDPWLLGASFALCGLGLVMIWSATSERLELAGGDPMAFVTRQATAMLLGVLAMAAVMIVDYRRLAALSPLLYGASLVLLLGAVITGGDSVEANRAIALAGFQLQPSELAKPALILVLASLFHSRRDEELGLRALVEGLSLTAVPMALIMLQPDLGTAIVFVVITAGVLLIARLRFTWMLTLALLGALALGAAMWTGFLEEYQVDRLVAFMGADEADPLSAGYNLNQAKIAVGSGQFLGKGLGQGTQTSRAFVPENHTDFIFTVVGEELGFVGSASVLVLWAIVLLSAVRIAALSRDLLGTLIAGGIVAVWGFQVFINVGMTMGIMPITGLALPFVSFGGTSLIGTFLMLGLLQNVHMRRAGA